MHAQLTYSTHLTILAQKCPKMIILIIARHAKN